MHTNYTNKNMNKIKIIFFGTPEFAVPALQKLIENKSFEVLAIVCAPDKPLGRKQILTPPPIKVLAQKNKIPIFQPEKIENFKSQISNCEPDLIIVCAFGQFIPKNILDLPKYGCLNIHPSLLPKYRGPSPIQSAILNREEKTGVSIILLDDKMDHGPVIANFKLQISNYNYEELSKKLADLGAQLLIETIPQWINEKIKPVPQNDAEATFTKIIKKEDGKIDWQKSAREIENQLQAFYPWPGSFTLWHSPKKKDNLKIKIISAKAELNNKNNFSAGKIFFNDAKKISVSCGNGYLILEKIQLEGKKEMKVEEFIKGYPEFMDSTSSLA